MKKILSLLAAVALLTGCSASKYSLVAGEYGWDKRDTGGSQYSSDTMYKVNSETGEAWRMTYEKSKGYYWDSINHLNLEKTDK